MGLVIVGKISDKYKLAFGIQTISDISMILVMVFILIGMKFYNRDLERVNKIKNTIEKL